MFPPPPACHSLSQSARLTSGPALSTLVLPGCEDLISIAAFPSNQSWTSAGRLRHPSLGLLSILPWALCSTDLAPLYPAISLFPRPHFLSCISHAILFQVSPLPLSIHTSLQLSPSGPFSLCPLRRVLISPHPDPSIFSLPLFFPGTPFCVPGPQKSAAALPLTLFPSLFPTFPNPVPSAL